MIATRGLGNHNTLVTAGLGLYETIILIHGTGGTLRSVRKKQPPEQAVEDIKQLLAEDEEILAIVVLAVSRGLL